MNTFGIYKAIELAQHQEAPVETIRALGYLLQANLEMNQSSLQEDELRNAKELAHLGTGHTSFKSHW